MAKNFDGIRFAVPYEIAVVRPLRQTTLKEREEALPQAYHNTELIPQDLVYVDLKTDSRVSSLSTAQMAALSALKDFLIPAGELISVRDEKSYPEAYLQCFLDGAQPASSALAAADTVLREIFGSPRYLAGRVEQVRYLWRRLRDGVPVLCPAAGHAVFIDVRSFLPRLRPEHSPAEALAAFIYHICGIRITKGPPLAQSQTARGTELLRLAVPARRDFQVHVDDAAEAVLHAYSRPEQIKGLRRMEREGRSRYDPPLFEPIEG